MRIMGPLAFSARYSSRRVEQRVRASRLLHGLAEPLCLERVTRRIFERAMCACSTKSRSIRWWSPGAPGLAGDLPAGSSQRRRSTLVGKTMVADA